MPGAREGNEYTPDVFVAATRAAPVASFVAVIETFGTAAPVLSRASPVSEAAVWPKTTWVNNRQVIGKTAPNRKLEFIFMDFFLMLHRLGTGCASPSTGFCN